MDKLDRSISNFSPLHILRTRKHCIYRHSILTLRITFLRLRPRSEVSFAVITYGETKVTDGAPLRGILSLLTGYSYSKLNTADSNSFFGIIFEVQRSTTVITPCTGVTFFNYCSPKIFLQLMTVCQIRLSVLNPFHRIQQRTATCWVWRAAPW